MRCWHCNTELIWGGDHDNQERPGIVTNLSCPNESCQAFVLVYLDFEEEE